MRGAELSEADVNDVFITLIDHLESCHPLFPGKVEFKSGCIYKGL